MVVCNETCAKLTNIFGGATRPALRSLVPSLFASESPAIQCGLGGNI